MRKDRQPIAWSASDVGGAVSTAVERAGLRGEDKKVLEMVKRKGWKINPETQGCLHFLAKRRTDNNEQSHLADTLEIIQLVPEEIQQAAMLHDIGKTGPREESTSLENSESSKLQQLITSMFAFSFKLPTEGLTISQFVDEMFKNKEKISLINVEIEKTEAIQLLTKIGLDIDKDVRSGFLQKHVEWGKDMLDNDPNITDQTKFIALNHHAFISEQNVEIEGFEPTEDDKKKTFFLEVVDYYQASRRRGKKDHNESSVFTKRRFEEKLKTKPEGEQEKIKQWLKEVFKIIDEKQIAIFENKV